MCLTILLFFTMWLAGLISVSSNPSPYYGTLGLVLVSGMGCGMLVAMGEVFLAMILFLIYLGGMLILFAYASAFAADPFPEDFTFHKARGIILMFSMVLLTAASLVWVCVPSALSFTTVEWWPFHVFSADSGGVASMYSEGGLMLVIAAWVLLLTLFAVLELTRGLSRGALRAV